MTKKSTKSLSKQIEEKAKKPVEPEVNFEGNFEQVFHTGSTLLDLAISGDVIRGGGIPSGILVEIFGPSGSGKTVLLSELAGAVTSKGGEILFNDPEARLNRQFAKLFGLELKEGEYMQPDTVTEVFSAIRSWKPVDGIPHGIFADSLAALSTNMEMGEDEGDKMGMRRAKEFSEELRRTCRLLKQKDYLMVCSNQIRINVGGGSFAPKYRTPGGEAVGFYSSIRLRTFEPEKIRQNKTISGKALTRVIGVNVQVEVFKNSVSKPYRSAPVTIIFDYGIDDIRQNLQFIKDHTKSPEYTIGEQGIGKTITSAIKHIEDNNLEDQLREETIDLWEEIESKFESKRKPRRS